MSNGNSASNECSDSAAADIENAQVLVPVRPLVSLCMIARDNEKTIGNALETAKPWVDEIIVLDTGSIDRTREIAHALGARVETFEWCDDFSAARNRSLEFANGEWIFWMDTDDTLPPKCGQQIRNTLGEKVPDDVHGFIMQVHCPANRNEALDGSEDAEDLARSDDSPACSTVVDHIKLFRNRHDIRFEGRIHEQILPAIRRKGGRVVWSDMFVVHSGADYTSEGVQKKYERDIRILKLDAQDRPRHPFVQFNLGMTLLYNGENLAAQSHLEKSVELSTTDESHLRKAYVLLVDSLELQGRPVEACRRCWEGLGRYPNDPELSFKLGRLLMAEQKWDEAIDALERVFAPNQERCFSSIDPGIKGFKTFANLAICHQQSGRPYDSIGAWFSCLNDAPRFLDGWEGVIELSREVGELQPLIQAAGNLEDKPGAEAFVFVCRAIVFAAQGFLHKAEACFEDAILHKGAEGFTLNEYARFLNEHEEWMKSLPVLRKLRDIDPADPSPHYNIGVCLIQLGRPFEAAVALQASLQLRPGHALTHKLLIQCKNEMANRDATNHAEPPAGDRVVIGVCLDGQESSTWEERGDSLFAAEHWIRGVVNNRLRGVVIHDCIPEEIVKKLESEFVSFQRVVQNKFQANSSASFRFKLIQDFLDAHPEIERAYCTDLIGVGVAGDPFELLGGCGALCISSDSSECVDSLWRGSQGGSFSQQFPESDSKEKNLLNCAIFGGTRSALIDLCVRIQRRCLVEVMGETMGELDVFNQVLYLEVGDDNFWAEQGPLHSVFNQHQYERQDVAFVHK